MAAARDGRRYLWLAFAITLFAFVLRVAYFAGAEVTAPVRGDILEYWRYALNLVQFGVFSSAEPGASTPLPDAWRSPGYPLFLAACLRLTGDVVVAVAWAQWLQMLLGALLAPLTIALGRRWLAPSWALAAGLLVAVWPHLVVFASTLLSETLFAFVLLSAALLASLAQARGDWRLAALAGVAGGVAALVNPVALLFPMVLAAVLAWRGQGRVASAYLLAFALVAGAWEMRNASLSAGAGSAQRAQTNFVQGSWPLYHAAANDRGSNRFAAEYFARIEAEIAQVNADPRAGLGVVFERMRSDPGTYLRWYLLQKPWLLWDWAVRVGWGDIYFLETRRSPFERVPVLAALRAGAKAINPALFALACGALALAAWRHRSPRRASAEDFALLQVALLLAYLTAVHVVLQAEPRYAVAYRPMEILLALTTLAAIAGRLRRDVAEPG